jgi:hypothetical protein
MRPSFLALTVAAALLAAPAALAAPTCQNENGATTKCGTPGAMPVGWTLTAQQRLERHVPGPNYPNGNEFWELLCIMGVYFALMALLPEFDGRRAGDWGKQEGDEED